MGIEDRAKNHRQVRIRRRLATKSREVALVAPQHREGARFMILSTNELAIDNRFTQRQILTIIPGPVVGVHAPACVRRDVVWRRFHAIEATRVHLTMKWVVFLAISGRFGPSRDATRSETAQNRKRSHPRPSLLETTHIDKGKAPYHTEIAQ
jgi:hypothetical protein